jgi:hypothetical protein
VVDDDKIALKSFRRTLKKENSLQDNETESESVVINEVQLILAEIID